jgi:hypothetical protein
MQIFILSEWVSDCCLMPIQQFFNISWREQVNFQWDDDEVRFALDQQAELDSASSLKQQSADRPTQRNYADSEPTSLCSFSLMLCA